MCGGAKGGQWRGGGEGRARAAGDSKSVSPPSTSTAAGPPHQHRGPWPRGGGVWGGSRGVCPPTAAHPVHPGELASDPAIGRGGGRAGAALCRHQR